jgi:hypothetical protein
MAKADREHRLRFLASLEEEAGFWGLDRLHRWLARRDETRPSTSPLSRHLTWQARAAAIALLAFSAAFITLFALGDSLALSFWLAVFLAAASFFFQANLYWQLPAIAHGGTVGSLLWTILVGVALAAVFIAAFLLLAWWVSLIGGA